MTPTLERFCGRIYGPGDSGTIYVLEADIPLCEETNFTGTNITVDCGGNTITPFKGSNIFSMAAFNFQGNGPYTVKNCIFDLGAGVDPMSLDVMNANAIQINPTMVTSGSVQIQIQNVSMTGAGSVFSGFGIDLNMGTSSVPISLALSDTSVSDIVFGIILTGGTPVTLTAERVTFDRVDGAILSSVTAPVTAKLTDVISNYFLYGIDVSLAGGVHNFEITDSLFCGSDFPVTTDIRIASPSGQQSTDKYTNLTCDSSTPSPGNPVICQNPCPM
jgi:hypothetical protein